MASLLARVPRPASTVGRDALGALVLAVVVTVLLVADGDASALVGWEYATALGVCAAMPWRRRAPVVVSAELWTALIAVVGVAVWWYRRGFAPEREHAGSSRDPGPRGRCACYRARGRPSVHGDDA